MSERTGNLYATTSFRNGGRRAGSGVLYDDYSEESGVRSNDKDRWEPIRFPHDGVDPKTLNGPVIRYQGKDAGGTR